MRTKTVYKTLRYCLKGAVLTFLFFMFLGLVANGIMGQTQPPVASVIIENNLISSNTAESGGGLGIYNASPIIRNNIIISNASTGQVGGGAVYSHGLSSNPILTVNTISNNSATTGQGGGIYSAEGQPVISNTILWLNQGDLFNCTATYSNLTTLSPGTGNISADPAFVQTTDPNASGYYRLSDTSPCIDVGDPAYLSGLGEIDIDGNPRKVGARIDIGADELPDVKGPAISNVTFAGTNLTEGMVLQQSGLFGLSAVDPSSVSRVEFLLDGQPVYTDTDGSNGYTCSWNIYLTNDGAHTFTITAYDTLGNSGSASYTLNVALNAPPAPLITSPVNGTVLRTVNITVAGMADIGTTVLLYNNNQQIGNPVAVGSNGNFSIPLTLLEGANHLRATASNRAGIGPMSTECLLTLDTSLPKAPVNLSAQSKEGGLIALTWTAPVGTLVKGYYIYRASAPFSSTSEAIKINTSPLSGTSSDNLPPSDGIYYYAVSTVDQTDQESPLSNLAFAGSDHTPPWAVSIEYLPLGQYASSPLRIAQGLVNIRLTVNEPLLSTPFLSMTPNGGIPISIDLTKVSGLEYTGSFAITESTPGGPAYAVFSARDLIGNRGTTISSGASFIVDAQGPAVISIDTSPRQPIKNDSANPVSVTLTIGLNEALKSGTVPELSYLLSGPGRSPTAIAQPTKITTKIGQAQTWQAVFSLPADAGLTAPENLQFIYRGSDDLDNVSTRILCTNSFQVYQGDLPPLAPPTNLMAKALPGGKINLSWNGVAGAVGYRLYRKPPSESTLTPYLNLGNGLEYTDTAQPDGIFRYAVASIRQENSQESVSGMSNIVEVTSDSVPPGAPQNLVLQLIGSGIRATWVSSLVTEPVTYSLYRSNLPEITSVQGMTAVLIGISATTAVDPSPSHTDHSYVVTAADNAGNESSPSNSFYLNFDLLPVSTLKAVQTDNQPPVIFWTHSGGDIAGYNIYLGSGLSQKLNSSIVTGLSFTDTGYTGDERRYTVTAIDNNGRESLGRTITLPNVFWALPAGEKIKRGIINSLEYTVNNHSTSKIEHARLKALVSTYSHQSDEFTVDPGSFRDVSVPMGGYAELPDLVTLVTTMEITPEEGALVQIVRSQQIEVVNDKLILQIGNETFTRGGLGKVWFTLENTGEKEIEILTATGGSASNEVTLYLIDVDGNVFSSQAYHQTLGANVVTLSNGDTLARIPVGSIFTSNLIELPIPLTAPDQVAIRVEISKIRFHYTQPDQVSISGLNSTSRTSLKDTAYYGAITNITPESSAGDEDIAINGRAVDRTTGLPLPSVPLKLVITVSGFERSYTVVTDNQGNFNFAFKPTSGDSGLCKVRAVHPEVFDKPVQGQFIIGRLSLNPSAINLNIPKNYEQTINIQVATSEGTLATNLRLVYEAQDQESGALPPGIYVTPGPAFTIGSKQSAALSFKIWADNEAVSFGKVIVRAKSNEEDSWGKVIINTAFSEARPALWYTPDHVETGVAYNQSVSENITLENKGLAALTDVTLSLVTESGANAPNWVHLNSVLSLGDMAVGDKRQVSVSFSPTNAVPEGVYPFLLRIICSNYQQTDIRLYVSVTQSGIGNAIFKVSDIYTGQIQNGQIVQGLSAAKVTLQKETTLEEQSKDTDSLGESLFTNLSVGTYKYRVTAPNHQEQIGRLWIKPGITISKQVFLPYNLVNVEWEVRETTIKDKYEIVLHATYETNVPAPVVVIEPKSISLPNMKAGQVYNGEFTITNYGLVRADNVQLTVPPSDQYLKYEMLKGVPQSLGAGERIVVPYRVTALMSIDQADEGSGSGGGCFSYLARIALLYSYLCANGTSTQGSDFSYFTFVWGGSCGGLTGPSIVYSGPSGPWGDGPSGPSQPISGSFCPPPRSEPIDDPCDPNNTKVPTHSNIDVLRGEYLDLVTDMSVKVFGQSVEVKRRYYDDKWYFDGDYLKLSVTYGSLGNITSILKDGVLYKSSDTSGKVFTFKTDRNIYVKDSGYRWENKSGAWAEYDSLGRMISYGNRNNVKVSLMYETGANGKLLGLADNAGTQVLWYEYNPNESISAVRDSSGRWVQYFYDASRRLIKVTDVLGKDTFYTYDGAGRMTSKKDAAGRTYTITYNEYGFVKSVFNENNLGTFFDYSYDAGNQERYAQIKYSSGRIIERWYDRFNNNIRTAINGRTIESVLISGRNKTVTDAAGNKTYKEYDPRDNLIKQTNPDGTIITYEYEPRFNQVTREVNERGVITKHEYDSAGNLLRKIEAFGTASQRTTEYTCDASGNLLSMKTLGDGKTAEAVTTMAYDGFGNVQSTTDPEGITTAFTYDAMGNMRTRVDARNKTWTYNYDGLGRLLSVIDPLGSSISYEYDGVGNKTKEIDPEGRERVYVYDLENRLIRSTQMAGTAMTQFVYNTDGKLVRQVDPEGKENRFEYDLDGSLTKTIDGNGNQITNEYADAASGSSCSSCSGANGTGQPSRTIFPTFSRTYAYDSRGRKMQETDVLSDTEAYVTQFFYDGTGNVLSQIDKEGKTTISQYDELSRRIKLIDPLNQITEYAYDNRGNLLSLKDAKGNITTFEYDKNNRLTKETRPMGQATRYFYNPLGALDYKIDAKNQKIAYEYDDAGRIIRTKYFASSGDSSMAKTINLTYSPSGNLLSYNDGTTSATYTYDDGHRKLTETVNYGAFQLIYAYDYYKNGLKKSLTMPDGTRYDYTYDTNNQPSTISIPGQGVMTYNQYTWNAPAVITLPGGIRRENTYSPLMQLKTIGVKDLAQNALMNYAYDYSPAGNITAKNTETRNYVYQYDPLYRLTNATNPPASAEAYTYDPVGNRLTSADVFGNWNYNINNELSSYNDVTYEFDVNGNTTKKTDSSGINIFVYDVDNRLIHLARPDGSTIADYYYDPFGRRLSKDAGGIKKYFFYTDEGLTGEYDVAGVEIKTYGYAPNSTWSTNPLFQKVGSSYYYYQNDHLGTPQKITDSNGTVVWSATYDAFGKPLIQVSAIENNLRFPGQYYDAESGLHYNWHRYYDPKTGRYITADPIRMEGGDANFYSYVQNNPNKKVDPKGLKGCGPGDEWGLGDLLVPDHPFGHNFSNCCDKHDDCYDCEGKKLGKTKRDCDKDLCMCLIKKCLLDLLNPLISLDSKIQCPALTYCVFVITLGKGPFDEGRKCCP